MSSQLHKEFLTANSIKGSFLLICFVALIILCTQATESNADNWEYRLTHDLLDGYDKSIRPSSHHNLTLNVTFGLALAQIIDVDERNMIITTNCWLNQVTFVFLEITGVYKKVTIN